MSDEASFTLSDYAAWGRDDNQDAEAMQAPDTEQDPCKGVLAEAGDGALERAAPGAGARPRSGRVAGCEAAPVEVDAETPTVEAEGRDGAAGVELAADSSTPAQSAAEPPPAPVDPDRAKCQRFVEAFGAKLGGKWYAEGLTFVQAEALHTKALAAENAALRRRLEAAGVGADEDEDE